MPRGKRTKQRDKTRDAERRPNLPRLENRRPAAVEQEWTLVERPKRPDRRTSQAQAVLVSTKDNKAQRAWRGRDAHRHTITIPPDLINTGEYQRYLEIAQQYGAYVGPLTRADKNVYGIWADDVEQAAAARQALNDWVQREGLSKTASGKSQFGRQQSMTNDKLANLERRWLREVQRHEYRQSPAIGAVFEKIGTFHWPVEEMDPQEVLGHSLEALDAIRVDCACHIILDDEEGMIKVLGDDEGVTEAIMRIRFVFFQITARQHRPLKAHLVHWEDSSVVPSGLYASPITWSEPYDLLQDTHTGAKFEIQSWEDEDSTLPDESVKQLQSLIMLAVRRLRFYSGDITFRVQLGTFVATDFKTPENEQYYLTDELAKMLQDTRFTGEVIPQINGQVKDVLKRIMTDEEVLPRDFKTAEASDVLPLKRAQFRFRVDGMIYEYIRDWQEEHQSDGTTSSILTSKKWLRLDQDNEDRHQLLDANLVKLDSGMAWNYKIDGVQIVPHWRLPGCLRTFADRVQLNSKRDKDSPFVVFVAGGTGLVSLTVSTIYAFQLKSSDWRLDVSCVQQWKYGELKIGMTSKPSQISTPHWILQMHHAVWQDMFDENSALKIGAGADWSPDVQTWFPTFLAEDTDRPEDGFKEMLQRMSHVEKLLNSRVDRHTGMSIN